MNASDHREVIKFLGFVCYWFAHNVSEKKKNMLSRMDSSMSSAHIHECMCHSVGMIAIFEVTFTQSMDEHIQSGKLRFATRNFRL